MLVRNLLKSSIFISSIIYLNPLLAATVVVNAETTASGFNDYQFTANVLLLVPDEININNTLGVSVNTMAPITGTIRFDGNSIVTGSIGVGVGGINQVLFRTPLGKTVIFQGAIESDSLEFGIGGAI